MSESQRYHVVERIAAGGMAEVYRGESAGIEGFRKKVAIKKVLPKLSANREFITMFLDEARLCAYLSHSRCVQVFDIGQAAGSHFIVMEFVDGADLKEVLEYLSDRQELMPVEVAVFITIGICEGLAYAHAACDHHGQPLDIVHRDISPHNVLMTRFGEVKLVDFGLAKASSHLTDEDEDIVKGKFGYLAPEVTQGKGADKRVDIFAAGILLWEMLCGRRLFKGENDLETFKLVRAAQIPDPRKIRNDVPDDLVRVLAKALVADPAQRYQTADEFARDLAVIQQRIGKPVTYQDVAGYVKQAADERARRNKAEGKGNTAGMVGDIVLDALHDFSAGFDDIIEEVAQSPLGTPGVDAGTGGDFENPAAWGLDDLLGGDEPAPAPARPAPAQPAARPAQPAAPPAQPAAAPAAPAPAPAPAARQPAAAPRQPAAPQQPGAPRQPAAAAPPPARRRERPAPEGEEKEGPFWRRWFGS